MQDYEKELEENLAILERLKSEGVKIIEPHQEKKTDNKQKYEYNSKRNILGHIKNSVLNKFINKDKIISFLMKNDEFDEEQIDQDNSDIALKEDYDSMIEGMKREARAKFNEQNFLVEMPTSTLPVIQNDDDLLFDMTEEKGRSRKLEKKGSFLTSIIIMIITLSVGVILAILMLK